jgi:transcription elongation GreA/GreB family factor
MFTENKKRILAKEDFDLLTNYLKSNRASSVDEKNSAVIRLIETAQLVDDADFPWEVVQLNSKVIIRDKIARLNYTYIVVMPELADHKQCKVSAFSTIGSALLGHSRGHDIFWSTPKGRRHFTIMAVSQYAF